MNPLYRAAIEVQRFFQDRGWRFCIIGGLAVIRWGHPRATADVDVSLFTGFGQEAEFVRAILDAFDERIRDAAQFAAESRVVLAKASNGTALDIALAAFPYEEQVIENASAFEFEPGLPLITASAEDLIVLKAFSGRDQDWADIEGIAERQGVKLDWDYVLREAAPLCELAGATDAVARLEGLRGRGN